jgi:hypothetical protein
MILVVQVTRAMAQASYLETHSRKGAGRSPLLDHDAERWGPPRLCLDTSAHLATRRLRLVPLGCVMVALLEGKP